jgi:hypothetical protein
MKLPIFDLFEPTRRHASRGFTAVHGFLDFDRRQP